MSNAYMEQCTGDYIWQIDADEFYKAEDIEKVKSFLIENPDVTRIDIQTINFWHGFKAIGDKPVILLVQQSCVF